MSKSKDWAPWRNAPNLSAIERSELNNNEFWRLITKAPVGRIIQISATLGIASFARLLTIEATHPLYKQVTATTALFASVCLGAVLVLLLMASNYNDQLKRSDRELHSTSWWLRHMLFRYSGKMLFIILWSVISFAGVKAMWSIL